MNDVGYLNLGYKGSNLEVTINNGRDLTELKRCTEMAVEFHKEQNNPIQVKYFSDALNAINKKMKV